MAFTHKKTTLLFMLIIILAIAPFAHAELDSDGDRIKDEFDICPDTNPEDSLPATNNIEYLGCSCKQIIDILNSKMSEQCYELFCEEGRALLITERKTSKDKLSCPQDYCIDATLYDFPESQQTSCVDGFPQEPSCIPALRKNSALCITKQIQQYDDIQKEIEENLKKQQKLEELENLPPLSSHFFNLLLDDLSTKNKLSIGNREDYQSKILGENILKIKSEIVFIEIGNVTANLTQNTITITPPYNSKLQNVILVERISTKDLKKEDFIFGETPETLHEDPWIVYWQFDEIKEQKTISYRIRKQVDIEQEVLLLAKVKNQGFFWQIVPIMMIIFVFILTYIWLIKDSEKRRIFK